MFVLSQGVYIHGTISLSWYAQLVKGWFTWNASPNTMKTTATFVMSWMTLSSHNKYKSCLNRKWQDYVYIQCEYKSTKQKIKHLLREENKVKENKIS